MNINLKYLNNYKTALFIVLILGCFFSFWKLGQTDIREWDEARRGVNALEMIERGDYINYYYAGEIDTWNAKPPLAIWTIVLSYKIFGYNSFALRFPSAMAIVLLVLVCFHIISLYRQPWQALFTCLILLSFKGIVGHHVGRTGDTDALFILFLTLSCYFFLLYVDFEKPFAIILTAICLGFAYYTKGFASFLFFPGAVLYIILKQKRRCLLANKRTLMGAMIFLTFIFSWVLLNILYGQGFPQKTLTGESRLHTMVFYDVFKRLFSSNFEGGDVYGPLFIFPVSELTMGLWSYIFWFFTAYLIMKMVVKKMNPLCLVHSDKLRLFIFSVVFSLPIVLILSIARNIHTWYIAPALPFFAIMISEGICYFTRKFTPASYLFAGLLIITSVIRFHSNNSPRTCLQEFFDKNESKIELAKKIILLDKVPQSFYLYLAWSGKPVFYYNSKAEICIKNLYLGKENNVLMDKLTLEKVDCFSDYCFAKVQ
ncbi:MAG: ArnT family glycosyltransferase [Bacteroidota bacterium]